MKDALLDRPVQPDVQELLAVIRRTARPRRVHHLELFLDPEIKEAVCRRFDLAAGLNPADPVYPLEADIRVHRFLGYDAFRVPVIRKDAFPLPQIVTGDTAAGAQTRGERAWVEEHAGPIRGWEDFASYPWPKPAEIDLRPLEWMEKNLPDGMGCYDLTAHILEVVTFLLGYESLCYLIYDDPPLVDAVCRKVGEFYLDYTRLLCDFRCVALIWGSDDMGYRSSTMVPPSFLREKILPWHRRCAEAAHRKDKPYLLHACGNLEQIMEDLIRDVGIDGRHSYEDAILPVTEAFRRYGERVAVLGGIDMDFLCRSTEKAVRARARATLDACFRPAAARGYCLGTGNTVANYLPLDNYLAMLDEGRRYTG